MIFQVSKSVLVLLMLLTVPQALASSSCPPNTITINAVPVTLTASNTVYCISNNLSLVGVGPAITVNPNVHDIVIDFAHFMLTLPTTETGILLSNNNANVQIKDGTIQSSAPSIGVNSNCISVRNFTNLIIENMTLLDTRRGLLAPVLTDTNIGLKIRNTQFNHGGGLVTRGVSLGSVQDLEIVECDFLKSNIGILLGNNFANAFIHKCNFSNQGDADGIDSSGGSIAAQSAFNGFVFQSTNLHIDECNFNRTAFFDVDILGVNNAHVSNCNFFGGPTSAGALEFAQSSNGNNPTGPVNSGLLVENCNFQSESTIFSEDVSPVIQLILGTTTLGSLSTDAIIRNCTFTALNAPVLYNDIFAGNFKGLLIEKCVFSSTGTGFINGRPATQGGIPTKAANIHLGSTQSPDLQGSPVEDVTIRGCQMGGASQVGVYAETGPGAVPNKRILIEDCNITAVENGILFENTVSSTILNCQVKGVNGDTFAKGEGIALRGPLSYNPNASSSCNAVLNNTVTNNQDGIVVECGAQGNLLKENNVFNNSSHQIVVKDHNNKCLDNTAFKKPKNPCATANITEPIVVKKDAVKPLHKTHGLYEI